MAEKQSLNATFFAFRKRERSGVLTSASIAFLVLAVLFGGAFFFLNAQAFMDYLSWASSLGSGMGSGMATGKPGAAEPSMEGMMPPASVMALGGAYFLFLLGYYVLLASYEAACLRWMIRGETGGIMGLSLGADTWRVYFTYWVWFFLLIAFYIVLFLIAGGAMMSMMAVSQGGADMSSMGMVPVLLGLLLIVALIYFGVRFAPAAATSVARRKFAFFDAWTVTKGRFWALFGAYFLLFVMFIVFYLIVASVFGFAMAGMAMTQVNGAGAPQTPEDALRAFANPQFLLTVGLFAAVMVVASMTFYVALFGVNARAAVAALEEGKIKAAE